MIKPLIFVLGAPHSMTSMTIRFLKANGLGSGLTEDKISGYKGDDVTYISSEDWAIRIATIRMKKFKFDKIEDQELKWYFKLLPKDETIVVKVPWSVFFLDKLQSYTKKPIKIVYCLRNPHDVFVSTFEKENYKFTFFRLFHLWNQMYKAAIESKYPIFMLPVERLANKDETLARELLWFCLRGDIQRETNWSTIETRHIKKRKYVYLSYRMSNFVFKMVDRITKRMNW